MKTPNPMGARSMRHNEMELIAMTDKQTPSAEQFAHKINVVAGRSVRAAVMLGRLFLRAKENLPHGQWGRLFKGHRHAVKQPVPFGERVAQRYMEIAEHEALANPSNWTVLPAKPSILRELATIEAIELNAMIADGRVHASMKLADAMNRIDLALNAEITRAPVEIHHELSKKLRERADDLEQTRNPDRQDDVAAAFEDLEIHDAEPGGRRYWEDEAAASMHPGSPEVVASCESTHAQWYRDLTTRTDDVTELRRKEVECRLSNLETGRLATAKTARTYLAVQLAIAGAARTRRWN